MPGSHDSMTTPFLPSTSSNHTFLGTKKKKHRETDRVRQPKAWNKSSGQTERIKKNSNMFCLRTRHSWACVSILGRSCANRYAMPHLIVIAQLKWQRFGQVETKRTTTSQPIIIIIIIMLLDCRSGRPFAEMGSDPTCLLCTIDLFSLADLVDTGASGRSIAGDIRVDVPNI